MGIQTLSKEKPLVIIILYVVFSLFLIGLGGCEKGEEREKIREVIENVRLNAEKKAFPDLLEYVADSYSDNLKHRKDTLQGKLKRTFSGFERLEVQVSERKLEIDGSSATATLVIRIEGVKDGKKRRIFGAPVLSNKLLLYFQKPRETWKIVGSFIEVRRGIF